MNRLVDDCVRHEIPVTSVCTSVCTSEEPVLFRIHSSSSTSLLAYFFIETEDVFADTSLHNNSSVASVDDPFYVYETTFNWFATFWSLDHQPDDDEDHPSHIRVLLFFAIFLWPFIFSFNCTIIPFIVFITSSLFSSTRTPIITSRCQWSLNIFSFGKKFPWCRPSSMEGVCPKKSFLGRVMVFRLEGKVDQDHNY